MKAGDYVIIGKYPDFDPLDPWFIGFYAGWRVFENGKTYHCVMDKDNKQIGGFMRCVKKITSEKAQEYFLYAEKLK